MKIGIHSTREVLDAVQAGKMSVSKAERILKLNALAVVDEIARLDLSRTLRRGVPEIVYAQGKSDSQIIAICKRLLTNSPVANLSLPIIVSKASDDQIQLLSNSLRSVARRQNFAIRTYAEANIAALVPISEKTSHHRGRVGLLCAGTSDIKVLNEAKVILDLLGCETLSFNDVGIAFLKRLSSPLRQMHEFDPDAIIVAAGMEGALPSLIAGLSSVPVIGLPTSVGFGYGKNGEAALMSMLQACPMGICVVNIDGGVAAGIIAWLITRRVRERMKKLSS